MGERAGRKAKEKIYREARMESGGQGNIRSGGRKLSWRGRRPAPESAQAAVRTAKAEKEAWAGYPDGGVPGKRISRKSSTR